MDIDIYLFNKFNKFTSFSPSASVPNMGFWKSQVFTNLFDRYIQISHYIRK